MKKHSKQNTKEILPRNAAGLAAIQKTSAGFMRDKRKRREKEKDISFFIKEH